MAANTVVTIARQYGSGWREIGLRVAEKFGVKCYDKELLDRAAKDSGICQELFEHHDEKPTNSFLYSLVMDTYSFGYSSAAFTDMPINHKVFLAQFDAINKIASEESCVMVGRCADYALSEHPGTISVFIHADMDKRIYRISRKYELSAAQAKDRIQKTDKQRSSYYNYYTSKKWGDANSYHLCLDSGILGIEGCVEMILKAIEVKDAARQTKK